MFVRGWHANSKAEDSDFAHETFAFLKKALRTGEKHTAFQPRGPKELKEGDWLYLNTCNGDITRFEGHEEIYYKNELIFVHDYFGGIVKDGRKQR